MWLRGGVGGQLHSNLSLCLVSMWQRASGRSISFSISYGGKYTFSTQNISVLPEKIKFSKTFFQTTQHKTDSRVLKMEPFSDLISCDFINIISPVFIRYHKNGQSLLVLLPTEESEMIKALEVKKIPIHKIRYSNASWYYNLIFRYAFSSFF